MTINCPNFSWPKLGAFFFAAFGCIATAYADSPILILGLPIYKFFGMLAIIAGGGGLGTARQNNHSDEESNAGVKPKLVDPATQAKPLTPEEIEKFVTFLKQHSTL